MFFFHPKMKKAKDQQLAILDGRITRFSKSIMSNNASEVENGQFQNIISVQELVRSMYEYPFNYDMLAKVSTSTLIPYLAAAIASAIQRGLRIGT